MATRKSTKKSSARTKTTSQSDSQTSRVVDYFKFGESYTSLILGIVVVIIASILLIAFVRNRGDVDILKTDTPDISSTNIGPDQQADTAQYTVQEGDDLWTIAEQNYDSGYNWVDIQEANNIEDPNQIAAGTELIIPDVEPKVQTTEEAQTEVASENQITGSEYTIQAGDTLWNIAIRKYNDGYQWVQIAEANNLNNPDVILIGNTLTLP